MCNLGQMLNTFTGTGGPGGNSWGTGHATGMISNIDFDGFASADHRLRTASTTSTVATWRSAPRTSTTGLVSITGSAIVGIYSMSVGYNNSAGGSAVASANPFLLRRLGRQAVRLQHDRHQPSGRHANRRAVPCKAS